MPNLIGLAGGQAQKQTRFAPIYTGRWSSGIWTNRSPLRDANTTRLTEKFYGASGDALIAGSNVEITNRLTLGRRPGNSVYDSNTWNSVDRFYDFRLFNLTTEEIYVMIDQAAALFSLFDGIQTQIFTKTAGAGSTFMQSVGNSLYFGNGIDNKKWVQTLTTWQAGFNWTNNSTPTFTTFLIDPAGNIQQLTTAGISGGTEPTWNETVPSVGNNFQGGTTTDGTSVWTNRGNPMENWGIAAPTGVVTPVVGSSRVSWQASTYYSLPGVLIDSNGNLQQVTTAGLTAGSTPTWQTTVGATTTSGTAVFTLIQLASSMVWQPNTSYPNGHFVIGTATGTNCLFQLASGSSLAFNSNIAAYIYPQGSVPGVVYLTYPTSLGSATESYTTLSSLQMTGTPTGSGATQSWNNLNGAGVVTGTTTPFPTGADHDYQMVVLGSFDIPVAGQYAFTLVSHDAVLWGIGDGAQYVSGPNIPPSGGGTNPTQTAVQGYPVFGGNNNRFEAGGISTNSFVLNFPTAGTYHYEIDYAYWFHSGQQLNLSANGQTIPFGTATTGTAEPVWPAFTTSNAPNYATVSESAGQYVWSNLGPVTDFTFLPNVNYTLPNNVIIDPNGYTEGPFRTGATGTTAPTFTTALNGLTLDNPNLIWINQGAATQPPAGSLSTFNGGWQYAIALVNTLDNTVSNATQLSIATGNHVGFASVTIPPASGLGNLADIDPQADYVAIFRTTDGEATPFLIPGTNTVYTIPLSTYITSGYTDTTPDTGLNNLIEAPIGGENTPPANGAINLTFHLNRIFYSIGNTVYWTSGPDTPIGNGVNGTSPLDFDTFPSLVKRMVPTTSGLMVFTVSDVYLIQGSGTSQSPIQSAIPIMTGIGLLNYDALDINGSIIGFFSTDNEFIIIDPAAGVTDAGFPIGDQLRQTSGNIGQNWNPANVYVTWHVQGEDKAWYVSDGVNGWFRLMATPSPESGYTWSPFATIQGGCKAVTSIEVTPGVHRLLLGPTGTGPILNRDLNASQDNGVSYPANAVIGSAVLAQPGQVAVVSYIVTDSAPFGTPLTLGVLMDEALPYYTGTFDILKENVPETIPLDT